MTREKRACVIGGSNIDITGTSESKLVLNDSNPGRVSMSLGGVGRNIAENLCRMGIETELITAFGCDKNAQRIQDDCDENEIFIQNSVFSNDIQCPMYLCVNDMGGDMHVAVSSTDIMQLITPSYIEEKIDVINESDVCVIDANLPKNTIDYIIKNCKVKIFLDTVSTKKTELLKGSIKNIFTIKPNIMEAEILSGIKIKCLNDMKKAVQKIHDRNITNVFVSMGKEGVYFSNRLRSGVVGALKTNVVNANGAGDSFISALVWAYLNQFNVKNSAKAGIVASFLSLQSNNAVSENISEENIIKIISGGAFNE